MNRFDKFALAAAILVTLLEFSRINTFPFQYYLKQVPDGMLPMMVAGWALVTYGPLAIAACFWRWAGRISRPWVLHLLFVPSAAALMAAGERIMLATIQDPDFDAMFGGPMMPALFLFLATVVGYFSALIARKTSKSGNQVNPVQTP